VSIRGCAALGALVLFAAFTLIPASALGGTPYWQQIFLQLTDPPASAGPKARTRATIGNLEALAEAGFGSAEVGVDFQATPEIAQREAHALLEAGARLGVRIDWAPGTAWSRCVPPVARAIRRVQLHCHRRSRDSSDRLRSPALREHPLPGQPARNPSPFVHSQSSRSG
jgi:hypothetical protein